MRINNNLMAMNTHRQYSINNSNVSKSVEKLSSGYRINRAGDDAAGLAISEKMRAQIRGLTMASKNSQDAVSLVQTAEGALQTTHDILQRMRELAVQSASDSNETTIDRAALDKEFQALMAEIDDTANKTRFNDMNLIDGSFASVKTTSTYNGNGTARTGVGVVDGTYNLATSYTEAVSKVIRAGEVGSMDISGLFDSQVFSTFELDFTAYANPDGSATPVAFADSDSVAISNVTQSGNTVAFEVEVTAAAGGTNKYTYKIDLDSNQLNSGDQTVAAALANVGDGITIDFTIAQGSTVDDVYNALQKMSTNPAAIDTKVADFTSSAIISVDETSANDDLLAKFIGSASSAMNGTWTLGVSDISYTTGPGTIPGTDPDVYTAASATFTLTGPDGQVYASSLVDLSSYVTTDGGDTGDITLDFGAQIGTLQINLNSSALGFTGDVNATAQNKLSAALEAFNKSFMVYGGQDAIIETTPASAKIQVTGPNNITQIVELKEGMTGFTIEGSGVSVTFDKALTAEDFATEGTLSNYLGGLSTAIMVKSEEGNSFVVQTGANQGDDLAINIDRMDAGYLGIAVSNISTREAASSAITEINDAINQVSTQRAALGALQNRLEFKIQNLDISAENLQSAESRIRDLDMAAEMTTFTKNNILAQAATAMLAQANSLPQNVLQLLQ